MYEQCRRFIAAATTLETEQRKKANASKDLEIIQKAVLDKEAVVTQVSSEFNSKAEGAVAKYQEYKWRVLDMRKEIGEKQEKHDAKLKREQAAAKERELRAERESQLHQRLKAVEAELKEKRTAKVEQAIKRYMRLMEKRKQE